MQRLLITALACLISVSVVAQDVPKPCKKIKRTVDEFTGDIKFSTPSAGLNMPVLLKVMNGDSIYFFLRLEVAKSTLNIGEGVIVLLENGERITRPQAEIEVDAWQYGYKYSSFFRLTEDEVELLSTTKIKKCRLYIHDAEYTKKLQLNLMTQMGCLIDMK